MERSIKFYRDGLGYKTDCRENNPPKGNGFSGITLAYNVEHKEDVETVIALVRKAGGKIVKEPKEVFWGGLSRIFFGFRWILLGSFMGTEFSI